MSVDQSFRDEELMPQKVPQLTLALETPLHQLLMLEGPVAPHCDWKGRRAADQRARPPLPELRSADSAKTTALEMAESEPLAETAALTLAALLRWPELPPESGVQGSPAPLLQLSKDAVEVKRR